VYLGTGLNTHCSFVGVVWVIECVDVETLLRHRTLKVLLGNNILPQLTGVGGTWHSACHADDDGTLLHLEDVPVTSRVREGRNEKF
jgi:hypothetical protein